MEISDELIMVVKDIVEEYSGGIKGTEIIVELWGRDVRIDGNNFLKLIDFIETNESCGLKVLRYSWLNHRQKTFIYTP